MPTTLGQKYSVDWRGRPPHMLQTDIPVWYRWLETYQSFVRSLFYDCFLGGPYISPEQEADPLMRSWRASNSKRADAIVETQDEVWIIEVSDYPGMRAIGQMITYQTLWLEDPKILKLERMLLVCATLDNDLAAAAGKMGIQCYII